MKALKQEDIIRVMREEWQSKVKSLSEQVDVVMNSRVEKKNDVPVLSPELKVMHKTSGIRYTIDSVGPRDAILRTPEGDTFLVDKGTFEKEYELD